MFQAASVFMRQRLVLARFEFSVFVFWRGEVPGASHARLLLIEGDLVRGGELVLQPGLVLEGHRFPTDLGGRPTYRHK